VPKNRIIAAAVTTALMTASAGSAEARWYHRHYGPGPVAGLVGGVVVGAATIATLPFALLAGATRPAPPPPPPPYYGPPPPYGYGPPPGYYRGYYPPPPRYYGY
jgi:hypothetical protein